jgi:hypothetical protein
MAVWIGGIAKKLSPTRGPAVPPSADDSPIADEMARNTMTTAAHVFEVFSSWCAALTPFLVAIRDCLKALYMREKRWQFISGIVGALFFIGIGCYSVYRLIA